MAEALKVAYLAQGKLYITQLGKDPKLVESAFVQELLDRAERSRERNNWKDDGMAWNLRGTTTPVCPVLNSRRGELYWALFQWTSHDCLERLVPENDPAYTHDAEGPDDMPAHIKAALTASSLGIPVVDGRLGLGTWQGIYLWEHRRYGGTRRVLVHVSV